MVISVPLFLADLVRQGQGKAFSWSRPSECPRCHTTGSLWGHGYVLRYFHQLSEGVFLKRWRCQSCKAVVSTRPSGFWRCVRTSIRDVYDCLLYRVRHGKWPPKMSRQRARYWLNKLNTHASINLLARGSMPETVYFYSSKNLPIFGQALSHPC